MMGVREAVTKPEYGVHGPAWSWPRLEEGRGYGIGVAGGVRRWVGMTGRVRLSE